MIVKSASATDEQNEICRLLKDKTVTAQTLFWQHNHKAIILGRSQRITEQIERTASSHNIETIIRSAGGGAVIAGQCMLSACTIVPTDHTLAKMSLPKGFALVGGAWQKALEEFGISTEMITTINMTKKQQLFDIRTVDWACFAGLSHGELVDSKNRKLLGLAQIRKKHAIAIVSGILLSTPDWATLIEVWNGKQDEKQLENIARLTCSCEQLLSGEHQFSADKLADQFCSKLKQIKYPII